jgi:hypothetical protein
VEGFVESRFALVDAFYDMFEGLHHGQILVGGFVGQGGEALREGGAEGVGQGWDGHRKLMGSGSCGSGSGVGWSWNPSRVLRG